MGKINLFYVLTWETFHSNLKISFSLPTTTPAVIIMVYFKKLNVLCICQKVFTGAKSILSHDKLLKRVIHVKEDKVLESQMNPTVSAEEIIYFSTSIGLLKESQIYPTKNGCINQFKGTSIYNVCIVLRKRGKSYIFI